MDIYCVNVNFINALRAKYSTIMMPKNNLSTNGGRKYIGIAFEFNEHNFFIPISSPNNKDYEINQNGKQVARKSIFSIYLKHTDATGNEIIDSVLNVGNMIPIPKSEIQLYAIASEPNPYFKRKFQKLFKFIRQNDDLIKRQARKIYYLNNSSKPINFKNIINDVAEYTYDKMIYKYENKISLKNTKYYDLENKNCKCVILDQSDCGKYFATIPEKNLKVQNYKDVILCSIENKKIKQLIFLDNEVAKHGISNLNNIIKLESEKIEIKIDNLNNKKRLA